MATNIDKFLEPSELGSGDAVPIGGIIAWMSPSAGAPEPTPPTGFEYCDGTAVSTVGSTLFGLNKPELMRTVAAPAAQQRFPRGADTTSTYGGATAFVTGGNDVHNHTGGTDSQGSHNHSMQSHTHSMQNHTHSITNDGSHTHGRGAGPVDGFDPNLFGNITASAGTHNHGGNTGTPSTANTGAPNTSNTGSAGSHSHGLTINNSSTTPFFVQLAWIIRVI